LIFETINCIYYEDLEFWNYRAGLIADFHAKAIQNLENANLVGICSSNPDKARKLAGKYNCKVFKDSAELLHSAEIEIVTIATPSGAHMEPTIEAAMCGKHVICEKHLKFPWNALTK